MNYIGIVIVVGIVLISNGCGTVGKSFNASKVESIVNGITAQSDIKKMSLIFSKDFRFNQFKTYNNSSIDFLFNHFRHTVDCCDVRKYSSVD